MEGIPKAGVLQGGRNCNLDFSGFIVAKYSQQRIHCLGVLRANVSAISSLCDCRHLYSELSLPRQTPLYPSDTNPIPALPWNHQAVMNLSVLRIVCAFYNVLLHLAGWSSLA